MNDCRVILFQKAVVVVERIMWPNHLECDSCWKHPACIRYSFNNSFIQLLYPSFVNISFDGCFQIQSIFVVGICRFCCTVQIIAAVFCLSKSPWYRYDRFSTCLSFLTSFLKFLLLFEIAFNFLYWITCWNFAFLLQQSRSRFSSLLVSFWWQSSTAQHCAFLFMCIGWLRNWYFVTFLFVFHFFLLIIFSFFSMKFADVSRLARPIMLLMLSGVWPNRTIALLNQDVRCAFVCEFLLVMCSKMQMNQLFV